MTKDQKAKQFTDILSSYSNHKDSIEKMREVIEEIYSQGYAAALTSLLEDLPGPSAMDHNENIAQSCYRNQIKSLIQTKLK